MLRRLAPADLEAFQAYRHDPELGRFQGWVPIPDGDALALLDHMNKARLLQPGIWCQIGIAEAGTHELIGDIALVLAADARKAEIGFTLRRQSQGRGLATSAVRETLRLVFENTPAQRIIGTADARNAASIRLLERVGMRQVETRNVTSRGKPCTELVHAVCRRD